MVVLTVGGPQAQTVARRVRECDVFCEVLPANITPEKLKAAEPKGIIITGSFSHIPPHSPRKAFVGRRIGSSCSRG